MFDTKRKHLTKGKLKIQVTVFMPRNSICLILGVDFPIPMSGHCLDVVENLMIVVYEHNNKLVIYHKHAFEELKWMSVNQTNLFPCDIDHDKIQCKLYDKNHIVIPTTLNESACTAIFHIENEKWSKLMSDDRKSPFGGTLDIWHGNGDGLIYFGGSKVKNGKRDEDMWRFYDLNHGWKLMDIKLPQNLIQNATKMITLHPDFC